jgi:MFS family permease
MIQPILPLFYTSVLGLSKEAVGLIEGSLMTVVSLTKIGAGYLSDWLGRRKAIAFAGYGLSAVGRFALAFAGSAAAAFGLRLTDGVGKGIKDAPRDALVASSAGSRKLGLAFGIQRTLDTLGSVVGPLATYGLLRLWGEHPDRYREVFLIGGLVAALPLVIIGLAVRERRTPIRKQAVSLSALRGPFAYFLVVMLLFTLGNSSDAFLILRAQNVGLAAALIPVAYALFNLVSALAAIPCGKLSDRIGRRRVIAYGWCVYALAYLGFALANAAWMIWALYAFYGLFYALSEGAGKAMVSELVPEETRGTAFGLYNASVGVMALPASLIAGALWQRVSPSAPFAFGAVLAALALIGLAFVPRPGARPLTG